MPPLEDIWDDAICDDEGDDEEGYDGSTLDPGAGHWNVL